MNISMTFFVYILRSESTGRHYIGSTSNILRRLEEHNDNKVRSTRKRGPWKILFTEKVTTRKDAVKREMEIKSYKGGQAFKKLIQTF